MNKTSLTLLMLVGVVVILCLLFFYFMPWQLALVFGLLSLCVCLIVIAINPSFFLSPKKISTNADDIMEDFNRMLKDVFSPEIVLASQNTSRPYQIIIDKKNFTIGREEDCDYVLPLGNEISRKQVNIRFQEGSGTYAVMDMGSTNGTTLNDEKMTPSNVYPLKKGDILAFAGIPFQVKSAYY